MSHKLGIVVPYRDRESHLQMFLPLMYNYLTNNNIFFRILIVEQEVGKPFNRAKLLNVGFHLAKDDCDYYAFHDVDMLPNDANYSWVECPIHMATECSQFDYKLPYEGYFGGVTLFNKEDFIRVNGYSNDYWGWGAEDDDLLMRCKREGLTPDRRRGRYHSLNHERVISQQDYSKNIEKLKASHTLDYKNEGLNSLTYTLKNTIELKFNTKKYEVSI